MLKPELLVNTSPKGIVALHGGLQHQLLQLFAFGEVGLFAIKLFQKEQVLCSL